MKRENAEVGLEEQEKKVRETLNRQGLLEGDFSSLAQANVEESVVFKILKKVGRPLARAGLTLFYAFAHASVVDKFMISAALAYLILPWDIVPDFIPLLGFGDDASVMALALRKIKGSITQEVKQRVEVQLTEWFGP